MRGANVWISHSGLWILLLHLSSSFCIEDSSRHADLDDNEPDGSGHEHQSDFGHRRISPGNSVRSGQQPRPAHGRTLRTVRWLYQKRLRS
jgi:hypothetical protein